MRAPTGRQLLPQTGWPPPTVDAQGLVSPVRDSEFFYSAPTGAHRGAQPLSWESGPSLMAPPLLWTPGTAAAQAPGLPRELKQHLWPQLPTSPGLPATGGGVKDTFLVWQPLQSYHCAPQEPPPTLPCQHVEASAPPQPSHCLELAHTSLPNTPCPLKTPLGWGLPRPRGWLEDLNSGGAEACLEPALPSTPGAQVPRSHCGWVWLQGLLMMCLPGSPNPQTHHHWGPTAPQGPEPCVLTPGSRGSLLSAPQPGAPSSQLPRRPGVSVSPRTHFACSLSCKSQSCLTPMGYSPRGSSVHEILQALEWVPISSSTKNP